jgi:hypothetical protein
MDSETVPIAKRITGMELGEAAGKSDASSIKISPVLAAAAVPYQPGPVFLLN